MSSLWHLDVIYMHFIFMNRKKITRDALICNKNNFKQEEKYLAYNKKTCEDVKKILKGYKPLPIEINREQKRLVRVPKDADFEMKLGNTTYEVAGHFNEDGDEFLLNQLIRNLKN